MLKIVISPYSRKMRNGTINPKDYPHWQAVIDALVLEGAQVTQVGTKDEVLFNGITNFKFGLPLKELSKMIAEYDVWCSVDNFFQHLAHLQKKPGVVIFGQSDPLIFGHSENKNLLKDRKYLREKPFDIWEACPANDDAFVSPDKVVAAILGED